MIRDMKSANAKTVAQRCAQVMPSGFNAMRLGISEAEAEVREDVSRNCN